MAFSTISSALSTTIRRSMQVAELKQEAKIDDLKRELAVAAIQRRAVYGQKLTEARITHATWLAGLTVEGQNCYQQSLDDIEAIVNPTSTQS